MPALVLFLLLLLPLAPVALPAAWQSTSQAVERATAPDPIGDPVSPGEEHTLDKIVTVPRVPGQLDLLPVLDVTGSYDKTLPNVRRILPGLVDELGKKSNLRVGLVTFADDPCCGGDAGDYPYRLDLPLTDRSADLAGKLDGLDGRSGGDNVESWLTAVDRAITEAGFRPAATRVVLLSTDSDSHYQGDGSGSTGPTVQEVRDHLKAANVRLVALLPRDHGATQAVELANATGGSVQTVSRSSEDLDRAILASLKEVPVDLKPTLQGDCPVADPVFSPAQVDNLSAGMKVPFRLSFRVDPTAAPGTHECVMDFGQGGKQRLPLYVR